jgi:VWFA-related protein
MSSRFLRRAHLLLIPVALFYAILPFHAWASDKKIREIDLQPLLCPLALQQPNNDPSAGVDFVSDNEVLVYTVCHVSSAVALSTRSASAPEASDPNHLKAVLLDLTTGNAIKSFDWPTRGRGATVRVTHRGELLVQTDNVLRTVTLDGKQIAAIRLVKVGQSDLTFVNSSPAVDSVAVIQSSQAEGKTVNGVAVLDSHGLEPLAQWHDNGESWNIAVSPETAVRTQSSGSQLQVMDLKNASDSNANWNTIWSGNSSSTRPVFLGADRFAFPAGNFVSLFAAPKGSDRRDIDCTNTLGVRASRNGGLLATVCVHETFRQAGLRASGMPLGGARGGGGPVESTKEMKIDVYQANPFRALGSVALEQPQDPTFDFALSPSSAKVAVVDQLHLAVYGVIATANEPPPIPSVQTASDENQNLDTPSFRSSTRLVQVDTVVTDSQSHPVPDLAASDFTVLEDGKPQKISAFSYESPEKKQDIPVRPPLNAGAFTNRPVSRQTSPIIVLLLDGLNTPSSQQLYVRQEMLRYLRDLKPSNARMAVLALGSDLAVLQDFTTDLSSLQAAVRNYKRGRTKADVDTAAVDLPAASGTYTATDASGAVSNAQGQALEGVQDLLDFFSRSVANDEQDARIKTTVAALQAVAQSVAGYPGRKSLIWMSSSFPFTLGFDDSTISHFAFYKRYADDIRKTTALLTDANIAVYPIDARGLISNGGVADVTTSSASTSSASITSASTSSSAAPNTDISSETFKNFRTDESLNTVAEETGGKVFRNTNDLSDAIKAAIADSESHYILGYYLDRSRMDGKFHVLRVKVARKGVKVRSRTGFFALDVSDWNKRDANNPTKNDASKSDQPNAGNNPPDQGLIPSRLNGLSATGVLFEARSTPPATPGKPVLIELWVDPSTISFGSGPNSTYPIDLSFELAALKPDGKAAQVETRSAAGALQDAALRQFLKTGIPMKIEMPVPAGHYVLRVAIRDNHSGHVGSLDMPLIIN